MRGKRQREFPAGPRLELQNRAVTQSHVQSQDDTGRAAVGDFLQGFSITGSSDGLNELEDRGVE